MIKDAEGLFKNRKPDHVYTNVNLQDKYKTSSTFYDIEIWDDENFTQSDVNKSLRVVFHWIKKYWNFDRRYSSDPVVIQAMYYLYMIAYNLFHLYIHRNLRNFDHERETKKKFLRRFYKGLVKLKEPLYHPGISPGQDENMLCW